jgi:hypothetical protein
MLVARIDIGVFLDNNIGVFFQGKITFCMILDSSNFSKSGMLAKPPLVRLHSKSLYAQQRNDAVYHTYSNL